MSNEHEKTEYGAAGWDTPPSEEDYTLEEILAEYGSSRQQKILEEVEQALQPPEESTSAAEPESEPPAPPKSAKELWEERMAAGAAARRAEESETEALPEEAAESSDEELPNEEAADEELPAEEPEATHFWSLEELVGSTVGAVMEERQEPLLRPKRGLFSRKRQEETEQFYDPAEAPPPPPPVTEADSIGEEPELGETASRYREAYRRRRRPLAGAILAALVPFAAMAAEQRGITVPLWSGDRQVQGIVLLACLLLDVVLCAQVPLYGIRRLLKKRCVSELLVALAALAAVVDCVLWLLSPNRGSVLPYTAAAGLALCFAQWGISRESRGSYDSFRMASLDGDRPWCLQAEGQPSGLLHHSQAG